MKRNDITGVLWDIVKNIEKEFLDLQDSLLNLETLQGQKYIVLNSIKARKNFSFAIEVCFFVKSFCLDLFVYGDPAGVATATAFPG